MTFRIRIYIYTLILLSISSMSFAQNKICVSGHVYDQATAKALSDVNIRIGKYGTVSNKYGEYKLNIDLPIKNSLIEVSYVGFSSQKKNINISKGNNIIIDFFLVGTNSHLDEIVVTGTRTAKKLGNSPVITQVITAKQIQERGVSDVRNLLMQEVPGLNFQEVGFGTSIEMQGLNGKHILFLMNGERMTGEIGNNLDYGRIVLDDIERIEIVQGASSSLYGSQAMGGVINIITKKVKKTFSTNIGIKYTQGYQKNFANVSKDDEQKKFKESVDKQNIDAHISLEAKYKKISSLTSINIKSSDGYQLYDTDSLVKKFSQPDTTIYTAKSKVPTSIMGYQNVNISEELSYRLSDNLTTSIRATYYNSNRYDFNPDNKYEQNLNFNVTGKLDYTINDKSKLSLSFNSDKYDRNNRFELISDKIENFYRSSLLQPRLMYIFTLNNHSLVSGIEYTNETLRGTQFSNNTLETKKQYNMTAFMQDDWQLNNNVNIVGGIRVERNNNFEWNITPKLSILYKLLPFTIRFNYAKGYRAPGLKDLYMNWDHLGMFRIFGNTELKPESNNYFSIATEYIQRNIYINALLYVNQFYNKIEGEWRNNQKELHYVNKSDTRLMGANINARINPIRNLSLYTSINYLHPNTNKGIRLTTTSSWTANGRIEYKIHYKNQQTVLNLLGRYTGDKNFDVLDEINYRGRNIEAYYPVKIKSYVVFDFTLTQYIGKRTRIVIGVDNIFNHKAKLISFNSSTSPGRKGFISINFRI